MLASSVDTYPRALERHAVALDIDRIRRISNCPQRFRTPTVLVVDYSMPQMNGVEFCQALRDLPCKKILLTGTADESVAVAAFNRGLIHRYIRKSDVQALDDLEREILDLQLEYFMDRSRDMRSIASLPDYSFVTDPAIAVLLDELSERYQIAEHYLHTAPGGFLLYDRLAKPRLLIIETEQSMNAHYEVALDNHAPPSMLAALESREVIPNFSEGDGMYAPALADRWHRYCQPARRVEGREIFYTALFELTPDTGADGVLAVTDFLRSEAQAR
jgi:CheY-like chemotaxis protein